MSFMAQENGKTIFEPASRQHKGFSFLRRLPYTTAGVQARFVVVPYLGSNSALNSFCAFSAFRVTGYNGTSQ